MTSNLVITARRQLDTITHLETVSKARELSPQESAALERAIYKLDRHTRDSLVRPWTPQDEAVLIQAVETRQPSTRMTELLKRSPRAIYRRIQILRAQGRISIADRRAYANRQRSNVNGCGQGLGR